MLLKIGGMKLLRNVIKGVLKNSKDEVMNSLAKVTVFRYKRMEKLKPFTENGTGLRHERTTSFSDGPSSW